MHLEKPSLARYLADPMLQGYALLRRMFFAHTDSNERRGTFGGKLSGNGAYRLILLGQMDGGEGGIRTTAGC